MDNKKTLATNRLLVEPLNINDHHFIFELVNTKDWLKFIGDKKINTPDDASAYILKITDNQDLNYYTVKLKDNQQPIGLITLIKRDYLTHHDIGFAFLPEFYHKGYAYEASKAVLDELINTKKHQEILAITLPKNSASIKLLEKLGLSLKESKTINDEVLQVYSLKIA